MLHALLFPKTIVIAICAPVAAALLMYTFGFYGERGVVAYISYAFSAYALVSHWGIEHMPVPVGAFSHTALHAFLKTDRFPANARFPG